MACALGIDGCEWLPRSHWRVPICDEHRFERHIARLSNTVSRARFVYYGEVAGRIKIGSSADPVLRCKKFAAVLLAVEPGSASLEGRRLGQFRSARIPGETEWFRGDDPALRAHIAELLADSEVEVA